MIYIKYSSFSYGAFKMSDIAKLGFSVDTKGLKKGEKALDDFAKTGEKTEKTNR